jgi:hypothetical protein
MNITKEVVASNVEDGEEDPPVLWFVLSFFGAALAVLFIKLTSW